MSRSLQTASLIFLAPVLLGLTACNTPYSQTYSYQKTAFKVVTLKDGTRVLQKGYVFEPYEQQAMDRAEIDKGKREADSTEICINALTFSCWKVLSTYVRLNRLFPKQHPR
jgi:hypothetical protein